MKILRGLANCGLMAMFVAICISASSQVAAAQVWIASTGTVDPSSLSTYKFVGQLAYVRSSLATGTVTLRYNVFPAGGLLKPITELCCEGRALVVRFLDNGSAIPLPCATGWQREPSCTATRFSSFLFQE
jgi:hypothetical protein